MRSSAFLLLVPLLASCSQDVVSTHNFRGWSLDDFNPFRHAPPVVQVSEETLRQLPQDHLAYHPTDGPAWRKPVDYTPPTLPEGGLSLDGSLLPSKDGSFGAMLDVEGNVPDSSVAALEQDPAPEEEIFSIE